MTAPQPADLLIVSGTSWTSKLIEIGAILRGRDPASHIAVMHHTDANGVPWAIEGRPGGVGWQDARAYLADPRTVTNAAQPKTGAQREHVCLLMVQMLGVQYDWAGGIGEDAAMALHLPRIWAPDASGKVPGHVVCSSLAAWGYSQAGLATPATPAAWETVTPGDWRQFCEQRRWLASA